MHRLLVFCATLSVAACSSERRVESSWTVQLGSEDEDYGGAVATDPGGSVLVAGTTWGYLDPALPDPEPGGDPHAFVAKLDADGTVRWIRQLEDAWVGQGTATASDTGGNVYLAGFVAIRGFAADSADGFVVKYAPDGALQWRRVFATPASDYVAAVATDAAGDVFLAGYTHEGARADGFVVKYDRDGVEQWSLSVGGGWAHAIAATAAGEAYVAGTTDSGLDGFATAGSTDLFVLKLGADGARQWTRVNGSALEDTARGVATDAAGNVYVGGVTFGGLDGNPAPPLCQPYVAAYGPDGAWRWTRQLQTPSADSGNAVATDRQGNVFLAGITLGPLGASQGDLDAYVAKWDPEGRPLWQSTAGGRSHEAGVAVATDAAGNVFVAGDTGGSFDGNGSAGYHDAFVASFSAAGDKR